MKRNAYKEQNTHRTTNTEKDPPKRNEMMVNFTYNNNNITVMGACTHPMWMECGNGTTTANIINKFVCYVRVNGKK